MASWSLLIRNGSVVDGTGGPARRVDVAVEGDRVAAVDAGLRGDAHRVIDAAGHVVAPGFIDAHSHSDLFYFGCPSSESKIRQGCTTEVVGMCSFSQAPIAPGREDAVRGWAGGIGASLDFRWETFGEYLDALRAVRPSINVVHFVGHGALRLAAVGSENRALSTDDLKAMERRLDEAMDAGAYGYSTGLVYPPSAYATTEELVLLARSMARRGGLYFSHVRGESAMVEDSIREAIRIGEEAGVGVQIAHVKVGGRENWGKMDRVLRLIDDARTRGVDVSGDVYPYHAGSTKMDNLLPAWVHDGGLEKLLERIGDRATRRRIVEECLVDGERWLTVSAGSLGFDEIRIATCRQRELEGLTLAALARQTGKTPAEAMLDLLREERATVGMVSFSQNLENETIPTVARSSRSRSSIASAGVLPVCRASAASVRPSSSRWRHVAIRISSKPREPADTVSQRSPSTRHSSTMRRRVARSAMRSRSRPSPPSCTQAGSRLSILVLPA